MVALETEPGEDLLEGLLPTTFGDIDFHAVCIRATSFQIHRKEPKSNLKLKAVVTNVWQDRQQYSLEAQRRKKKKLVERRSNPSRHSENQR